MFKYSTFTEVQTKQRLFLSCEKPTFISLSCFAGLESTTEEEKRVEQPSAAEEPEREGAVGPTEQPPLSPEPPGKLGFSVGGIWPENMLDYL